MLLFQSGDIKRIFILVIIVMAKKIFSVISMESINLSRLISSLKTLPRFEFLRTFDAVLNGLLNPTLGDGFNIRTLFLSTFWNSALFTWVYITYKVTRFAIERKYLVALLEDLLQIWLVYSRCKKLQSASITSHSQKI